MSTKASHRTITENEIKYLSKNTQIRNNMHILVYIAMLIALIGWLIALGLFIKAGEIGGILILSIPLFILLGLFFLLKSYSQNLKRTREKYNIEIKEQCDLQNVYTMYGTFSSRWVGSTKHGHMEYYLDSTRISLPGHWLKELNERENLTVEYVKDKHFLEILSIESKRSIDEDVALGIMNLRWGMAPFVAILSLPFILGLGLSSIDEIPHFGVKAYVESLTKSPDTIKSVDEFLNNRVLIGEKVYLESGFTLFETEKENQYLSVTRSDISVTALSRIDEDIWGEYRKCLKRLDLLEKKFPFNFYTEKDTGILSYYVSNPEYKPLKKYVHSIGLDSLFQMQRNALSNKDVYEGFGALKATWGEWFKPFKKEETRRLEAYYDSCLQGFRKSIEIKIDSVLTGMKWMYLHIKDENIQFPSKEEVQAGKWYHAKLPSGFYLLDISEEDETVLRQVNAPLTMGYVIPPLIALILSPVCLFALIVTVIRFFKNRAIYRKLDEYYQKKE